jgi:trk system potassium uptake protein TrkH
MIVALLLCRTPLADALCLAFSTVSTGGFVTHSDGVSILSGGGLAVVTLFMFLSGINVAILYRFFTLRWRHIGQDEELHTYLIIFFLSAFVSALCFHTVGDDWFHAIHYSLFHIASTMSTCGFYIPKPDNWSFLVSVMTFVLIIMGASAGSTGGGIKLKRIIILMKYVSNYITRMMHPNAVFRVKVNGEPIDSDYINKIFAFVFLYIAFIVGGAFVLTLCGCSIPDAICMAAANISNLGPSPLINNLGGSLDYALLPALAKWTLTLLMLAGRLELFALIAILSPAYWRRG